MEASQYQDGLFGKPTRRPGDRWGFTYYLPAPMPRTLELDTRTVMALSEADNALGRLDGLGQLIPNPEVLLGPFLTREALASSRIEGTNASLSEVLRAEGVGDEARTDDVAEVERYLAATHRGFGLIAELPLTGRLIMEVHKTLMTGVRGEDKLPGELRRSPVWVGASSATVETATFVPPLPEHLPDLLSDWERFVNDPPAMPVLVRCALMHYQFETIHPFLDGNGRMGRLLIGLALIEAGRLTTPLLYLSGYLEGHRREYYDHLQGVREVGDVQAWLQFFLTAVKEQSEDAISRASQLVRLRGQYYTQCALDRSRVSALIPLMLSNPFLTVNSVRRAVGGTGQGARNLLDRATSYGWVRQVGTYGRGGMLVWVAQELFSVIESPTDFGTSDGPPAT